MNRKQARAAAKAALLATNSYELVVTHPARTFQSRSPVAVVISQALALTEDARDLYTIVGDIQVSIYVRSEEADGADAEDQLDDLVRAAALALRAAGLDLIATNATPETAPLRLIDGKPYRVERMVWRSEDFEED